MKQHTTIAITGVILGGLFSLLSAIRYYVIYPDTDRAIVYVVIGGLIICVSWLYERTRQLQNTLDAVEEYLASKKRI